MIKFILLIFFSMTPTLLKSQIHSEDKNRKSIIFLSSLHGLTSNEKALVLNIDSYLKGEKTPSDFFSQQALRELQAIRKEKKSYFLLEKPNLKEDQKKIQIRFWIWRSNNLHQGYFSLTLNEGKWTLQDLEIDSSI